MGKLGIDIKPERLDYDRPDRLLYELRPHRRQRMLSSYTALLLMVSALSFIAGGVFFQ